MLYHEFLAEVAKSLPLRGHWRIGQTYFNVLYNVRPDLAAAVRSTDVDPFYRDDLVPAFLAVIGEKW